MTSSRQTIEIRTRPRGQDTSWRCWLAIGALEGIPPDKVAREFIRVLEALYTELEFALFRDGKRLEG